MQSIRLTILNLLTLGLIKIRKESNFTDQIKPKEVQKIVFRRESGQNKNFFVRLLILMKARYHKSRLNYKRKIDGCVDITFIYYFC